MHFPNGLNFEADKPVRISVFASLVALSRVYSDDFPIKCGNYFSDEVGKGNKINAEGRYHCDCKEGA